MYLFNVMQKYFETNPKCHHMFRRTSSQTRPANPTRDVAINVSASFEVDFLSWYFWYWSKVNLRTQMENLYSLVQVWTIFFWLTPGSKKCSRHPSPTGNNLHTRLLLMPQISRQNWFAYNGCSEWNGWKSAKTHLSELHRIDLPDQIPPK